MRAIILSLLFVLSSLNCSLDEILPESEISLSENSDFSTNANNELTAEEPWKLRQLPNVNILQGPNEPLQVADALVRDGDGIYFLLWQYWGQGRYTGGWKINFGDIQVDARENYPNGIGSCDSCHYSALAKLGFDGEWKWVNFLDGNNRYFLPLLEWSDNNIAVPMQNYYYGTNHIHAVFSLDGNLLYSRNEQTTYSDIKFKDSNYVGSHNNKHYFTHYLSSNDNSPQDEKLPLDLELCGELPEPGGVHYLYSVDGNFSTDLIYESQYTDGFKKHSAQFNGENFLITLPYFENSDWINKITIGGQCDETYNLSSNEPYINPNNFTDAQGNPNRDTPVFLAIFNPNDMKLTPKAIASYSCTIPYVEKINLYNWLTKGDCVVIGGGWSSYNFRAVSLDENWQISSDLNILIDSPTSPSQMYCGEAYCHGYVINLSNMNFAEYPFLAGHYEYYLVTQPHDFSQAIDFYHSSHGVSLYSNHPYHQYNPNIVSSIPFEPFDEVPYNNENFSQGWKYVPRNGTYTENHETGLYLAYGSNNWANVPQNIVTINSRADTYGLNYGYPIKSAYNSSAGRLIILPMQPYIYNPVEGIQGVPSPTQGTYTFFLAKDDIASILSPFSNIADPVNSGTGSNNGGGNDGGNQENPDNTTQSGCNVSINISTASRSCSIPNDDMDWDGEPDSSDDDQDGDGRLDVIELTDTVENNDPATVDESVISNPELDSTHSISIIRDESNIEIIVDYEISLPLFNVHVPAVAYTNEDGTPKDPQDYDYTLNSKSELDRLEQHMCDSPNLNGYIYEGQTIPEWVENYSIAGTTHAIDNWDCEWLQRRTIDIMSLMMISDANELDTWRETIRYKITLDFTSNSIQDISMNIPTGEPSNDLQQWVWNLVVEDESASRNIIYHPWIEEANAMISVPASSNQATGDSNQGNDIPTRDGQWTIRFELDGPGPVDCGSYGMIYSSKDSYSSSDDIFISCSAEPEEEITFCIKIYDDSGMYEDSSCQTAQYFLLVAASGTDLNGMTWEDELNQDLDDWENDLQQDLDDWESDFDTDYSSGSDSEELFDDTFILLIALVLILGGLGEVAKRAKASKSDSKNRSRKKSKSKVRRQKQSVDDEYHDYQSDEAIDNNQYAEQEYTQYDKSYASNNQYENQEPSGYDNHQTILNSGAPPFEFNGEIDEDGWEVCEYPRGSSNWWWKNYPDQCWERWE